MLSEPLPTLFGPAARRLGVPEPDFIAVWVAIGRDRVALRSTRTRPFALPIDRERLEWKSGRSGSHTHFGIGFEP
jgi:hypothetical protein